MCTLHSKWWCHHMAPVICAQILLLLTALNPPVPVAAAAWGLTLDTWQAISVPLSGILGVELGVRWAWAMGLSAALSTVFWLSAVYYSCCRSLPALACYRIAVAQPPPSAQLLAETRRDALLGQFVVRPLLLYLTFPIFERTGMGIDVTELPSLRRLLVELALCTQIDDMLFYWFHRTLHHPMVYKHVHKQHHRYHNTHVLATEYAHPVEDGLNAIATMAGPLVLGSHMAISGLYPALKLWQSVDAHSGINLPFPLSPWSPLQPLDCASAHSFHHSHNAGMYGGYTRFWDWLCGTDRAYHDHLRQAEFKRL
jgi:sterol desaturase/sphingolipid hydroxylase (fatty acid hydroxylase superfamily)